MSSRKTHVFTALLALASLLGQAHEFKLGKLEIDHPWARATAPAAKNGAVYLKLRNGGEADALLAASAPTLAERTELHTHLNDQGVMRMRQVDKIDIPAKGHALLAPGGLHIMLVGLKQPLSAGQRLPLTLRFQQAGEIQVEVKVEALNVDASKLHADH